MGGLMKLFDLKRSRMARKVADKKHGGGFEAPRKDFPVETFHSFLSAQDDMLYNYQETEDWSTKKRYPAEAPMKKLISEEISKRPSIVARLMGLDMLPLDTESVSHQVDKHTSKPATYSPKEKQTKNVSLHHTPISSKSVHDYKKKPTPRYHPQEEELQKFKKEFEAWQVERLKEHSKVLLSSEDHTLKTSPLYNHDETWESASLRGKMVIKDTDKNLSVSPGPTRIVLLRPGPDSISNNEEGWASSSGTSEERGNMKDFLDEVKTRLKYELHEKMNFPRKTEIQYVETERLRNQDIRVISHNRSRSSMADNESVELGYKYNSQYTKSRSFRYGPDDDDYDDDDDDDVIVHHDELPPKNLVRSLSAPVSGTSFGKLLLEDRNILTGAQIRRKHEVVERVTVKVKKEKKEKLGLSLKEKVSSFKYSFTFRGKLFGRQFHLAEESLSKKLNAVKDIMDGPTVMMNFDYQYENSTEVPPSPASVCSSVHDELWRSADNLSPAAKSDVPLQDSLNSEDIITKEEASEVEMVELKEEDKAKTYIRDLLVASGLYDASSSFTNSISNKNFKEVEIFYRGGKCNYDHKLLFDLTNEALSTILGPRLPRGRKLLDRVWETTREYLYPCAENYSRSLDGLIGHDLKLLQWSGFMSEDVDKLGEDIEFRILGDLIEELVMELCLL